jgi:2-oxo-3-hexenedioate decarboxylase
VIHLEDSVRELQEAERRKRPIRPLTDTEPELSVATAYQIQRRLVGLRLDAGERLIGAKLGLTSAAKQQEMGVGQPIYGLLTDAMRGEPRLARMIHPRAEPEIALVIGRELRGPASVEEILEATRAVAPAIEIIDSRYDGFRFQLPDVIADNASAARFVLGEERPLADLPALPLIGCVLTVDGAVHATAAGAAVMDDPGLAAAWLLERLAEHGESLAPGSIVLTGGLTEAVALEPGMVVRAEFDRLGTVEVRA